MSFYLLNILIGSIGNALVVKYFAAGDTSTRAGSRFVIVLAVVDFVSSIWIPGRLLLRMIYYPSWPFLQACYISELDFSLLLATPWLLLAISLERARAIFKPFAEKLRIRVVLSFSILILACSFGMKLKQVLSLRDITAMKTIGGAVYVYDTCVTIMDHKDYVINTSIMYTLGIWLPMLLIAAVYIVMYLKLKKQAQLTQNHSTQDSHAQLNRISRTFTIVLLVFYICYLPFTLQSAIYYYLDNFKKVKYYNAHHIVFSINQVLLFSNSSMNPVIYSKIHVKIFNCFKRLNTPVIERLNCCKTIYTTPQTATLNETADHISVHYRSGSENTHSSDRVTVDSFVNLQI